MTPNSVLVLHSTNPAEDADCLQAILQFSDFVDCPAIRRNAPASLKRADGTVIFIVQSDDSAVGSVVYCIPDQERWREIELAAESNRQARLEIRLITDYNLRLGELILPSKARMILVSSQLLTSPFGRIELSNMLISSTNSLNKENSSKIADSVFSSTTAAAPIIQLPRFRTLQAACVGMGGNMHNFSLNAREAASFETDLFKGKIICVLRPENPSSDDPFWHERVFAHKRRRLIINVQGTFKKQPTGVVYAGAEISKPMRLGLVTRALAGVLLKLVDRFIPGVHSSFGDDNEQAHIVAPALGFFERIVVTPPGKIAPKLDEDIVESTESMASRRSGKSSIKWNTVDTFTFSFYSMNIDLPNWSLVGLPVSGDISLTTFWGDSALKLCMYEKSGADKQHRTDLKRYVFAMQIKYLGRETPASDIYEAEEDILRWSGRDAVVDQSESQMLDGPLEELEDESDAESLFYDAEQPKLGVDLHRMRIIPSRCMEILSAIDVLCPAWIEIVSSRGNYTHAFAVNINGVTMLRSVEDCNELIGDSAASTLVERTFSPRLSAAERMRRMIGWALVNPQEVEIAASKITHFRQRRRTFLNNFLGGAVSSLSEKEKSHFKLSGNVFRALSDRHWVQEYVTLTTKRIAFVHPGKKKPTFHINLASVVEVARLAVEDCPMFSNQYFLAFRSLGRSVYLMFGSEKHRERFISDFFNLKVMEGGTAGLAGSINSEMSTASRLALIDNPADEFMHKSSMWNCQRRRILNCGMFNFRHSMPSSDPMEQVEDVLRQALEPLSSTVDEVDQRRLFLDAAAKLKQADVRDLSEESKRAFFLNLYHLMIMHAYLILGPPDWSLKWISYFNSIAYEVSDDIFSLAELEHCILRSKMSQPSQFISRLVIPRSHYDIALSSADFRINFALNCGSLSNPLYIFVYGLDTLDAQLDAASRLCLASASVTRKSGRKVVVELPRICEWYFADFGQSDDELLGLLESYLSDDCREALRKCRLSETGSYDMNLISIRYQSYNYECRPLQLYEASSLLKQT
ncbi:hypothetical protein MPSEU_000796600 [Mayamaea pseudoterrestris]|nr:hypothetical protein MPSEU_000796600 [Mayamaea pseudoterrestris]